jgi:hypothetical protein
MRNWLVSAGTRVAIVRAPSQSDARRQALDLFAKSNGRRTLPSGYADIRVRRATRRDVARFNAARDQAMAWTTRSA